LPELENRPVAKGVEMPQHSPLQGHIHGKESTKEANGIKKG
jgi:hypothetical protein